MAGERSKARVLAMLATMKRLGLEELSGTPHTRQSDVPRRRKPGVGMRSSLERRPGNSLAAVYRYPQLGIADDVSAYSSLRGCPSY